MAEPQINPGSKRRSTKYGAFISTKQVRDMIPADFQTLPLRKPEPNKFCVHLYKDFTCVSGNVIKDALITLAPFCPWAPLTPSSPGSPCN